MAEASLSERLGGVFAIAAVMDHRSDAIVRNPVVGQRSDDPGLLEWHTNNLGRLPGLTFMRTLWVCAEKEQVLAAFAAHKGEVIAGCLAGAKTGR